MSYALIITCDVCRVAGHEVAFDRSDETFADVVVSLLGAGWRASEKSGAYVNGFGRVFDPADLELMCPGCNARGVVERSALLELRRGIEDAAVEMGRGMRGPYREAWRSLAARVAFQGAGVAIPRTHVYRLEGGQIVPITTEELAATIVEEWSPPLTVRADGDAYVFTWEKKDHVDP